MPLLSLYFSISNSFFPPLSNFLSTTITVFDPLFCLTFLSLSLSKVISFSLFSFSLLSPSLSSSSPHQSFDIQFIIILYCVIVLCDQRLLHNPSQLFCKRLCIVSIAVRLTGKKISVVWSQCNKGQMQWCRTLWNTAFTLQVDCSFKMNGVYNGNFQSVLFKARKTWKINIH